MLWPCTTGLGDTGSSDEPTKQLHRPKSTMGGERYACAYASNLTIASVWECPPKAVVRSLTPGGQSASIKPQPAAWAVQFFSFYLFDEKQQINKLRFLELSDNVWCRDQDLINLGIDNNFNNFKISTDRQLKRLRLVSSQICSRRCCTSRQLRCVCRQ